MSRRSLFGSLIFAVCSFALAQRANAGVAETVPDSVTGLYIPGWAENTFSTQNFFNTSAVNLEGVSHIYYAFLWINETTHKVYDPFNNLRRLTSLKSRWPATKLILSVGGGGFSTDIWLDAVTTGLTTFVDSTIAAMKAANADGIDLDWEFPVAATRTAFTHLCATLRARLDAEGAAAAPPRHYLLTAATQSIVTTDSFAGYDLPALKNYLDLFNIMTYTMHDPCYWETETHFHTAWTECVKALDFYLKQGVPATQLVLGLAFYGHVYTLIDQSTYVYPAPSVESRDCSTMKTMSYRAIMRDLTIRGGGVFVDAPQRSAYYVHDMQWVGFDIPETMAMKMQGSREFSVGGVFIWDASLDTPDGSLLRAVATRATNTTRPCGGGYVGTGTCSDPSHCCSEFGYCGLGEGFCGPRCRSGPCIQYPSPPPRPPAPPPNCGNGRVGGGVCAVSTQCCSSAGWCGTEEPWCGSNCVGGPCWYKPRAPPPPPSPPPRPQPPPPPPLSYGCGEGDPGNGTCPNPDECCSAFGWCASTPTHCGYGCRGGPCTAFPPPPPGQDGPMCGGGKVGNGQCGFPGECCSKYGYCGDTEAHCGPDCQGGACWFPPPLPPGVAAPPSPSPPSPSPPSPKPPAPKPPSPRKPSPRKPSPRKPPSPRPPSPSPPPSKPPSPPPAPPSPKPPSPAPKPPSPRPPPRKPPSPRPSPRKPPTPRPPAPRAPSPPPPGAVVGTCGNGKVGNRICPDPAQCCSAAGMCAVSADHCYWYCVGGPCWDPPPPPVSPGVVLPPSPPPPAPDTVYCGGGVVGNKQCMLKHMCCSAAGWCAHTEDHCLHYCVGGPCWGQPPPAVQLPNATAPSPPPAA